MVPNGGTIVIAPWLWDTLAESALQEDVGFGDLTTVATVDPKQEGTLAIVAREPLVACGLPVLAPVYGRLDPRVTITLCVEEGARVQAGEVLARLAGPARALLTGERVALNILQWLSGIATATDHVVQAVSGLKTQILDTRKTTPGWRPFEKYAVVTGGGRNHRFGLDYAVLIKDNHIAAAGNIREAVRRAKSFVGPTVWVQVEVDRLDQLEEALAERPDGILLDNMDPETLAIAVQTVDGRAWTEASGRVRIDTVRAIAESGVDAVSLGWITHSAPAVDIGADWS